MVGENIVVEVDDIDYCKGVEELQFSVVGRLSLQRGLNIPTAMEVKSKLAEVWKISNFKVIPLDKMMLHFLLYSLKDQCKALSVGSVFMKPGLMGFNRWVPGFSVSE